MDIISVMNVINASECLRNKSFNGRWELLKSYIESFLGDIPTPERIIQLGGELSAIFAAETQSRDQSDVSTSGNVWSRLVNWYLNICLIGTNCWAVNNWSLVPPQLKRALSVRINGKSIHNSKEIIVIGYQSDKIPVIGLPKDLHSINLKTAYETTIQDFFKNIQIRDLKVLLLSAKTNSSDMLGIPLFWNFCYKGNNLKEVFDIRIGNDNESPENLIDNKVSYSIVTVPTGKKDAIEQGKIPGKAALNKLELLDGGFYWGRPTSKKVRSFENFLFDNLNQFTQEAGDYVSQNFDKRDNKKFLINKLFHE